MRAVLDTNILARAVHNASGPAGELLDRFSRSPHVLVLSSPMLLEVRRVLSYPRLLSVHGLTEAELDAFVLRLATVGIMVDPHLEPIPNVVSVDPDDNLILATAIEGNAEVICTLDRHLFRPEVQEYAAQRGVRILRDAELLNEIRGLTRNTDA